MLNTMQLFLLLQEIKKETKEKKIPYDRTNYYLHQFNCFVHTDPGFLKCLTTQNVMEVGDINFTSLICNVKCAGSIDMKYLKTGKNLNIFSCFENHSLSILFLK